MSADEEVLLFSGSSFLLVGWALRDLGRDSWGEVDCIELKSGPTSWRWDFAGK